MDEFNERLELVYQGRTFGDLQKLTADLPDIDLHKLPATAQPPAKRPARGSGKGARAAWASYFSVLAVCTVIWAMTDLGGYFWPMWVAGPWGAILLVSTIFGTHSNDGRRKDKGH